jgi:hypothetical protein
MSKALTIFGMVVAGLVALAFLPTSRWAFLSGRE